MAGADHMRGDFFTSRIPADDSNLSPLQRVQRYARHSDGRLIGRVIQDVFDTAPPDVLTKQLPEIMRTLAETLKNLANIEGLMKSIPAISAKAIQNSERVPALKDVIGDNLIPLMISYIDCSSHYEDAMTQRNLIYMLKENHISKIQAEIKICPWILAMTKMETDKDCTVGAVMLMSKLAYLLGRDITERVLLKRFTELCCSQLFYIRRLTATHFGRYSALVGKDIFECTLLPCYLALCQDDIWGVRKSCAEIIMFVSVVCPPDLRKTLLVAAFVKLLEDESRYVREAAYQAMGPFISTFAEPPLIHINFNDSGELVMFNQEGQEVYPGDQGDSSLPEWRFGNDSVLSMSYRSDLFSLLTPDERLNNLFGTLNTVEDMWNVEEIEPTFVNVNIEPELSKNGVEPIIHNEQNEHEDDLLSYNEYNYWYISPPDDVDLDGLLLDDMGVSRDGNLSESFSKDIVTNHAKLFGSRNCDDSLNSIDAYNQSIEPSSDNNGDNLDNKNNDIVAVSSPITVEEGEPTQDVVPQILIDKFINMSQYKDHEMPYQCAYSFPGVILTLGKENWRLMKDTLYRLAEHETTRVRRTVASSLHDIARILGPDLATEDLSPLFKEFLKDSQEINIPLFSNFSSFLQMLDEKNRMFLLLNVRACLIKSKEWNWRFHKTLTEHLEEAIVLFQPSDVAEHIGFCAQVLMCNNAAVVRKAAIVLVTKIVQYISKDRGLTSSYLSLIAQRFAHSKVWRKRQTFALLCIALLMNEPMDLEEFALIMLPHLLDLSWDPIVNIRLVVANCIVNHIMNKDYFAKSENESLSNVLRRLQADKDRDVRMAADPKLL